ncbi:hypothetical protein GCM10010232_59060 [Streptomyces amakusaensis]
MTGSQAGADAGRLVLAEVARTTGVEGEIRSVETVSFGWVVYWAPVSAGGGRARPGGNGPFLVDRESGRVISGGSGVPVARRVAEYERRLRRVAARAREGG